VAVSDWAGELSAGMAVEAVGDDVGKGDVVATSGWSGGAPTLADGVPGPSSALSLGAESEAGSSSGSKAWESGLAGECSLESSSKCVLSAFSG
jgi:hypothetical protein